MADGQQFVGLDVGGTTMKAAVVDDAGTPLLRAGRPADTDPERGQDARPGDDVRDDPPGRRRRRARRWTTSPPSASPRPGLMDITAGLILDPPNLKPWQNVPVRDHVPKAFGKPTAFQNDANAAAYGEFWVGAGQDVHSMVLFTLGTGVGGGIIIDDVVRRGRAQPRRRARATCGSRCRTAAGSAAAARRGCLEAYASATTVVAPRPRGNGRVPRPDRSCASYYTANDDELHRRRRCSTWRPPATSWPLKVVDDTAYYLALGACAVIGGGGPGDDRVRRRDGRGRGVVPGEDRGVREAVRAAVPDASR